MKILKHGRLTLTLDPSQVFPDDPGAGTPAIVSCGNYSSTWHYATDNAELLNNVRIGPDTLALTDAEVRWLDEQGDAVEALLSEAS